jgi:hypothetical protein
MFPSTRRGRVGTALVAAFLLTVTGGPAVAGTNAPASRWDPRVAPLAAKVEKLRRLRFDHPVPVDFLPDAAFRKKVAVDRDTLSTSDRADLAREQSQLRALGLIGHNVNLFDAASSLRESDLLAFYSPQTKRVTVRGTDLNSVAIRVRLAHELTHALQDQHFDLTKLAKAAEKTHSSPALTALVEGDAERVERLYADGLSVKEQADYDAAQREVSRKAHDAASAAAVPVALEAFLEAPYDFGPIMLQVATAKRGNGAVDALFGAAPTNDAAYLTPSTLADGTHFRSVAVPRLAATDHRVGKPDTFGSFALYLVLASRLDPVRALRVADGWGGDSMVTFRSNDSVCLRSRFVGRTTGDAQAITDALTEWGRSMPPGAVDVQGGHDGVTMTACDRGTPSATAPNFANAALVVAVNRNGLFSALLEQEYPSATAQCAADAVVGDPAFRPVVDTQSADLTATIDQSLLSALRRRASTLVAQCAASHGRTSPTRSEARSRR